MMGDFKMDDSVITFRDLTFGVSGADVQLAGSYDLDADVLDFHGALKLQAKVSQTVTGWKHWVLKPVDPFLAKNGAGTYLKIQVVGNSKAPKFGRDKQANHSYRSAFAGRIREILQRRHHDAATATNISATATRRTPPGPWA